MNVLENERRFPIVESADWMVVRAVGDKIVMESYKGATFELTPLDAEALSEVLLKLVAGFKKA